MSSKLIWAQKGRHKYDTDIDTYIYLYELAGERMMPTKQQSNPGLRNFFAIKENFPDSYRFLSTQKIHSVKSSNETLQHPAVTIFLNSYGYANACDFNTPWPLAATSPGSKGDATVTELNWQWAVEPLRISWLTWLWLV